jgi:TolB-like protein/Tfp pilus assembly protein PilF
LDPRFARILRDMGLPPQSDAAAPAAAARGRSWRTAWVLAALVLAALIGTAAYLLTKGGIRSGPGNAAEHAKAIEAVAVLPFANQGGDPKTEPLSEGIPETVIHGLSRMRMRGLKVKSLLSVARYKGRKPDLEEVRRELAVGAIVTGTLRHQGDRLFINVSLIDVRDGNELWGEQYEAKMDDILILQDKISKSIAANLRLHLTGEEEKRLTKRYTEDPDAYLLYLEAVYHFNHLSPQELETAIDYCQRAIKKDQNYALAHARLGRCYVALGALHRGPKATFPEARKHLMKALDIDANLSDAHTALGLIHLFLQWNWAEAQRELKQGIDLDSDLPSWSPSYYGFYLAAMGQVPEALAVTRRSQELDPRAAPPRNHLAQCYVWMRQYDRAIGEAQKALELDPNYGLAYRDLGLSYSQSDQHEKAIAALQQGLKLTKGQPWIQGLLGYAYARAEQPAEARRVLGDLKGLAAKGRFGCAFGIARIYAAIGEKEPAFQWLQTACEERDPQVVWLKVDPTLDSLRKDPQFDDLLVRMGFADKAAVRDQAIRSVAVLPFQNVSGDPKTEYLSDGGAASWRAFLPPPTRVAARIVSDGPAAGRGGMRGHPRRAR